MARGQRDAAARMLHLALNVVLGVLCSLFELKLQISGVCPMCQSSACAFRLSDAQSESKFEQLCVNLKGSERRWSAEAKGPQSIADIQWTLPDPPFICSTTKAS